MLSATLSMPAPSGQCPAASIPARSIRLGLAFDAIASDRGETYHVSKEGDLVGHLELRRGTFRIFYPDRSGECLLEVTADGDDEFHPSERELFLGWAARILRNRLDLPATCTARARS